MRKFKKEIERVVIKIGTSSISCDNGNLDLEKIDKLCFEIANLKNRGIDVILVSSGAVGAGKARLGLKERPVEVPIKQAAAAVGQVALTNIYDRTLSQYGYNTAQILLTKQIEIDEEMNINTRNTLNELSKMPVIPIVNENDTISTYELKIGDNDTLSAIMAKIANADLLILLTDIDGLYTDNPSKNKEAKLINEVEDISEVEHFAKGTESKFGVGGMNTKINAAKICLKEGIEVVISSSDNVKNIRNIVKGEEIGTFFKAKTK